MIYDLQKASLWKRISAFLFDLVIMIVVVVGIAALLSTLMNYDTHMNVIETKKAEYVIKAEAEYEAEHGESCKLDLTLGYEELSDAQKDIYNKVAEYLTKDKDAQIALNLMFNYSLIICLISFFASYMILEFAVPMIFKNGQTLGKKMFGLGVMRTNSVKVTPVALFIRVLFGKCTIETLLPLFLLVMMFFGIIGIVGPIVMLGLVILEIVCICATRTNSAIHDLISDTVVVDLSTQMIFESEQALIDYKKRIHEQEVANAPY